MLNATNEIAGKYAMALFDLAQEEGVLTKAKEDMTFVAGVFAQDARLSDFLSNPFVDGAARKACIVEIFQNRIQALSLNFLLILAEKKLEKLLPLIAKSFQSLIYETEGIVEVKITTARELSPDEYGKVERELAGIFKKPIVLDRHVDKSLLGGIVVQIGDQLIDGSVSQRLRNFEHLLNNLNERTKGAVGA